MRLPTAACPSGYMSPPLADMTCVAHERAVFEAVLTGRPYPVTAMISLASNPLLTLPNVQRTYAALKALELYVVMDYYLTPSAALADYVFPAACTVERTELWLTPSFCLACPKGIGPLYERRDDYQFWRGLAVRLGQAEHWPWQTVEEVWDYRLAPAGLTFEELLARNGLFGRREYRRYERFGFGTPSGKVELRSSTFEALGCAPVPVYHEPVQSPAGDGDLAREYPLVLITGSRFMPMYHSEQRQIAAARAQAPEPQVSLHPDTAAALGLKEGAWAGEKREGTALRAPEYRRTSVGFGTRPGRWNFARALRSLGMRARSCLSRACPESDRRWRFEARVPAGADHRQPVHAHVPLRAAADSRGAGAGPEPQVDAAPGHGGSVGPRGGHWAWVVTPQGRIRLRTHLTGAVDPRMADAQHGWWFPERSAAEPELFGVFESNANMLCPDSAEFCSPEIGSWPHTALLCRVEPLAASSAE